MAWDDSMGSMSENHTLLSVLARLAAITQCLQSPISLDEIADRVGHCRRTCQRDIELLKEWGAPIILEIKPYKWRLSRRWNLWNALKKQCEVNVDGNS
jgi:hypothetical protein